VLPELQCLDSSLHSLLAHILHSNIKLESMTGKDAAHFQLWNPHQPPPEVLFQPSAKTLPALSNLCSVCAVRVAHGKQMDCCNTEISLCLCDTTS